MFQTKYSFLALISEENSISRCQTIPQDMNTIFLPVILTYNVVHGVQI